MLEQQVNAEIRKRKGGKDKVEKEGAIQELRLWMSTFFLITVKGLHSGSKTT